MLGLGMVNSDRNEKKPKVFFFLSMNAIGQFRQIMWVRSFVSLNGPGYFLLRAKRLQVNNDERALN